MSTRVTSIGQKHTHTTSLNGIRQDARNITQLASGLDAAIKSNNLTQIEAIRSAILKTHDKYKDLPVNKSPTTLNELIQSELSAANNAVSHADAQKTLEGSTASDAVFPLMRAMEAASLSKADLEKYLRQAGTANEQFAIKNEVARRAEAKFLELKLAQPSETKVQIEQKASGFEALSVASNPVEMGSHNSSKETIVKQTIYNIDNRTNIKVTDKSTHITDRRVIDIDQSVQVGPGASVGAINTGVLNGGQEGRSEMSSGSEKPDKKTPADDWFVNVSIMGG